MIYNFAILEVRYHVVILPGRTLADRARALNNAPAWLSRRALSAVGEFFRET